MKRFHYGQVLAGLGLWLCLTTAQADTILSGVKKYAYAANTGWLNFRPDVPTAPYGVSLDSTTLAGKAYGANFGWIDFGNGNPVDGTSYSNATATDFGVNVDGLGNLSGLAYGANVGWLNFSWTTLSDPDRPRHDLVTGDFTGYAYGANFGWINLATGALSTSLLPPEIVLEQPVGTDLTDGATLDFGSVLYGNSRTLTFTIRNAGDLPLRDLGSASSFRLTKDGANAAEFSFTTSPLAPLVLAASTTFAVQFTPTSPGPKTAVIHIANNDPDESPFDLTLTSISTIPDIVLESPAGSVVPDGGTVNFGNAGVGPGLARQFTVRSAGTAPLMVTQLTVDGLQSSEYTLSGIVPGSLAPGASATFTITLHPYTTTVRTAALHLISNAPGSKQIYDVNLVGTGVPPVSYSVLDPSFGQGGKVIAPFGTGGGLNDEARAVLVLASGNVLVAGYAERTGTGRDFLLARFLPTGALDTTFGAGGVSYLDYGPLDEAHGIAVTSNGEIIIAGTAVHPLFPTINFSYMFVAKFTAEGTLIPGYGGPLFSTNSLATNYTANAVALQPDGKLIVAGSAINSGTGQDFACARLTTTGSLDLTFGAGGIVFTDASSLAGNDEANAVVVKADGGIVLGGYAQGTINQDVAIVELAPTGVLHALALPSLGVSKVANALLVLPPDSLGSESILAAGSVNGVGGGQFMRRYLPDGTLEAPFMQTQGDGSTVLAMARQADGRLITAGSKVAPGRTSFLVSAWTEAGAPDLSFSNSGSVITSFGGGSDLAFAMALQADGRMIVAGSSLNLAGNKDVALARYGGLAQPDLTVEQLQGTDVADGSTQDFGSIQLGTSSTLTFTVRNDGQLPLFTTEGAVNFTLNLDGANAADFSVTASPAAPLAPGGSTSFTVLFTPASLGARTAGLRLLSNDPDESPFDLLLTGTGRINVAPSFTKGLDQFALANGSLVTVSGWATNVSAGPAVESGQLLNFVVSNDNPALFNTAPSVAPDGTLSFTLVNHGTGTALVTVALHDNGGTSFGGVDTSSTQTFRITAATFLVTNPANSGPGTLRNALIESATIGGPDLIAFVPGLPASGIILEAELAISDPTGVTVDASNYPNGLVLTKSLLQLSRLINITSGSTVTLRGLALVNGGRFGFGGFNGNGAAINNGTGSLTLANCLFTNNRTANGFGNGGALYSRGPLVATGCTFTGNTSGAGGAVYADLGSSLNLTGCTFSGCKSEVYGGAVMCLGPSTILRCTFNSNDTNTDLGANGGAIWTNAATSITHCTISGNHARNSGGGIFVGGSTTTLAHCIIAGNNTGPTASLVVNDIANNNNITRVGKSIVQALTGNAATGTGTFLSAAPLLDVLASNGGPTQTMRLLAGSPAINGSVGSTATVDQRGLPIIGIADIGAYEVQPVFGTLANTSTNEDTPVTISFSADTTGTITATSSNPVLISSLVLSGSGAPRGLTITPAANLNGTTTITLTDVTSGNTTSFLLTVTAVNDAPSFTKGADQLVKGGTQTFTGWATNLSTGPANEAGQTLNFILTNDNPAFFTTQPSIAPDGTLTFTTAANPVGRATVNVRLHDDGGTANGGIDTSATQTFTLGSLIVTNVHDSGSGSLRQAITDALNSPGADTISFDAAVGGSTISLASSLYVTSTDGLVIDASSLAAGITLERATSASGFFTLLNASQLGINITLRGLTFARGGGSTVIRGGAIDSRGIMLIENCSFRDNSALANVNLSYINAEGGAISSDGNMTLYRCTFSGNTSGRGGAISTSGLLTMNGCTLSGNAAPDAGAIYGRLGAISLTHCTISGNAATANQTSGGIHSSSTSPLTIDSSIIAGNTLNGGGSDIYLDFSPNVVRPGVSIVGPIVSPFIVRLTGPGTLLNVNPLLGLLAGNGGLTQTMRLLPGSPAINAAVGSTVTADQRGMPIIGVPDIGAYEVQISTFPNVSTNANTVLLVNLGDINPNYTVTSSNVTLLPASGLTFSTVLNQSILTLTPALNQSGATNITLTDTLTGESSTFLLTVIPVLTPLETWRQTNFGSAANSGNGADLSDPDLDGLTNLIEYALGLSPNTPDTASLPQWQHNGANQTLSITAQPNVTYIVETNTTLDAAAWTPVPNTGTASQRLYTIPDTASRLFFRTRVTNP